jgi:hypothetical protein
MVTYEVEENELAFTAKAAERYHKHYHNVLYLLATDGKSYDRANELVDAALAICGYPGFVCNPDIEWDEREKRFLALFL